MLRFEYFDEALQEARGAYNWYAAQSPEVADRFLAELQLARQQIERWPQAWTPYHYGTRVFCLKKFPYGLVYLIDSNKILGVAVCHLRRRPGYWRNRLPR